ncbi:CHAD domain-containing protein [Methylomonas montana]|uniref:CHAD domain-containing protein n=1 Tax=Methylomonas montana TaxID=3058963 RepID=UPI00265B4F98|nr:CHAD domain-containing protein [Methylomonas montana]WKJ91572.1 CHAD domain-containing protein [Methylomonas montana]
MAKHGGKLLIDALDKLWRKYRKRLKACRQTANEDNVHELRVSTRRLLALIELLQALQPQPALRRIRKTLKNQLDGFDELRDTQVMLFEIAKTMPALPELEPFLAHLHRREQQLLAESQSLVAGLYQPKLRRKIVKIGNRFKARTADTDLHAALLAAIDKVYADTINRYQVIDPRDLASIHHLRIAVKKLRYLLISVQAIITDLPEDHSKHLQRYLTRMGDIQNATVLLQTLEIFFLAAVPPAIKEYYQKQLQALIDEFMLHREEIFGFWRESDSV